MKSTERNVGSTEAHEALTEKEKLNRVVSWTIPYIEVDSLVKPRGRKAERLDKRKWISPITKVARIKADSQNAEGERIGFYPKGYIVEGVYTYKPAPKTRKKRPKYKPRIFPGSETVIGELYPKTVGIRDFATKIQGEEPLTRVDMQSAIEWARVGYRLYSNEQFEHMRWIKVHDGVPILVFSSDKDLHKFQPFKDYNLPENTQAVSYIAPVENGGQGTPLVACHETASEEDIKQHVRTLMMFSSVVDPKKATPILVSRFTPTLEDYLKLRINERILSLLVREKEAIPADWHMTNQVSHSIHAARSELFKKRGKLSEQSPFYIDNWLDIRKTYGLKYKELIGAWFEDEMLEKFYAIGRVPTVVPARELQLAAKVNFFSHFSNWDEAAHLLQSWNGLQEYRMSYGIPARRQRKEKPVEGTEIPTEQAKPPVQEPPQSSNSE